MCYLFTCLSAPNSILLCEAQLDSVTIAQVLYHHHTAMKLINSINWLHSRSQFAFPFGVCERAQWKHFVVFLLFTLADAIQTANEVWWYTTLTAIHQSKWHIVFCSIENHCHSFNKEILNWNHLSVQYFISFYWYRAVESSLFTEIDGKESETQMSAEML